MLSLLARKELTVNCLAAFLKTCNALTMSFVKSALVIWNVVAYCYMSLCRLIAFLKVSADVGESPDFVKELQFDD